MTSLLFFLLHLFFYNQLNIFVCFHFIFPSLLSPLHPYFRLLRLPFFHSSTSFSFPPIPPLLSSLFLLHRCFTLSLSTFLFSSAIISPLPLTCPCRFLTSYPTFSLLILLLIFSLAHVLLFSSPSSSSSQSNSPIHFT